MLNIFIALFTKAHCIITLPALTTVTSLPFLGCGQHGCPPESLRCSGASAGAPPGGEYQK